MKSDEELLLLTFADLRELNDDTRLRIYAEVIGAWARSSRLSEGAGRSAKSSEIISTPIVDAYNAIQQFSRIRAARR